MKPLKRAQYLAALKASQEAYQILAPSLRQVAAICPHLTVDQIPALLATRTVATIALPPVLVRGAFHIAEFRPADPSRGLPPSLRVDGISTNIREHFQRKGLFQDEAAQYADRHWGGRLVSKSWSHTQVVYVEDPSEDANVGKIVPRLKHVIWIGLNSHAILDKFRSPEEWEHKIAIASLNLVEGTEIEGDHGSLTSFNCSRCGGGLDAIKCIGCQRTVKDGIYNAFRVPWATPLPPKLTQLLEAAGHKFESKAA